MATKISCLISQPLAPILNSACCIVSYRIALGGKVHSITSTLVHSLINSSHSRSSGKKVEMILPTVCVKSTSLVIATRAIPNRLANMTTRSASSSDAPKFDELMAKAYNKLAESHRHGRGPWSMMTNEVVSKTVEVAAPTILDLATGPGEPLWPCLMQM